MDVVKIERTMRDGTATANASVTPVKRSSASGIAVIAEDIKSERGAGRAASQAVDDVTDAMEDDGAVMVDAKENAGAVMDSITTTITRRRNSAVAVIVDHAMLVDVNECSTTADATTALSAPESAPEPARGVHEASAIAVAKTTAVTTSPGIAEINAAADDEDHCFIVLDDDDDDEAHTSRSTRRKVVIEEDDDDDDDIFSSVLLPKKKTLVLATPKNTVEPPARYSTRSSRLRPTGPVSTPPIFQPPLPYATPKIKGMPSMDSLLKDRMKKDKQEVAYAEMNKMLETSLESVVASSDHEGIEDSPKTVASAKKALSLIADGDKMGEREKTIMLSDLSGRVEERVVLMRRVLDLPEPALKSPTTSLDSIEQVIVGGLEDMRRRSSLLLSRALPLAISSALIIVLQLDVTALGQVFDGGRLLAECFTILSAGILHRCIKLDSEATSGDAQSEDSVARSALKAVAAFVGSEPIVQETVVFASTSPLSGADEAARVWMRRRLASYFVVNAGEKGGFYLNPLPAADHVEESQPGLGSAMSSGTASESASVSMSATVPPIDDNPMKPAAAAQADLEMDVMVPEHSVTVDPHTYDFSRPAPVSVFASLLAAYRAFPATTHFGRLTARVRTIVAAIGDSSAIAGANADDRKKVLASAHAMHGRINDGKLAFIDRTIITFLVLCSEIVIFLLSLVPLNFIPVRSRKAFMQWSGKALANETVVWSARILLLLVGGVFVDTILRLQKLDTALHEKHDHHHSTTESTLEDLQYKTKLFYSQRNMYLSLTSLFLVLVLYRRIKDIYLILQLQDENDSQRTTVKALKAQVEIMINAADKDTPKKTGAVNPTDSTAHAHSPAEAGDHKDEIEMDPVEASGMRKRK
ncbi:hypothetical protein HK101_000600 [Irineochytrium annulatum]|nr:hypothetical protein HK101_000600 [Irineochytrium annulatum]